jgi:hypothetical protein
MDTLFGDFFFWHRKESEVSNGSEQTEKKRFDCFAEKFYTLESQIK